MFLKLIYSSILVVITSAILNYFYEKYLLEQPYVHVKLDWYANDNWTKECRDYIVEYLPDWVNDSFTPKIAKCSAACNNRAGSKQNILYNPECRTYPVMIEDGGTSDPNRLEKMTYAEATIPCFLNLSTSVIPGANRGIFTLIDLPKGVIFGPYTGVLRSAYGEEGEIAKNGGYAWRINRLNENDEDDDFYIDGVEETNSNYLRYVNSARWEEEQNVYVLMFNETVYYITYKNVAAGSELLVWYGKSYAEWLSIETVENSTHDWELDFAPKLDVVICDSCPRSRPPASEINESEAPSANPSNNSLVLDNNDENIAESGENVDSEENLAQKFDANKNLEFGAVDENSNFGGGIEVMDNPTGMIGDVKNNV